MGLVDYSSSASDSETEASTAAGAERPNKRRKTSTISPDSRTEKTETGTEALPPLPPAFHDLYASTVRPSPVDDPSLHQGRRRQIPHVAGNWPSHVYVEWHPAGDAHTLLRSLLSGLEAELLDLDQTIKLSTFLTSDLGAALPLHVSLSRPFVLRTEEKDVFLEQLRESVRGCGVAPFELRCAELAWHRSPDSNRSFLVLRVRSSSATTTTNNEPDNEKVSQNRELTTLLDRCNKLVASYGQPTLYQQKSETEGGSTRDAFHISIAWSFAEPTAELKERTAAVFARDGLQDAVREIPVVVDAIKVKIGNVVTNIPLKGHGTKGDKTGRRKGLFGV